MRKLGSIPFERNRYTAFNLKNIFLRRVFLAGEFYSILFKFYSTIKHTIFVKLLFEKTKNVPGSLCRSQVQSILQFARFCGLGRKYLEAYINNQYISFKNNTVQLYFIIGKAKLYWKIFTVLKHDPDIHRFSNNHVHGQKSVNIGCIPKKFQCSLVLPDVNIIVQYHIFLKEMFWLIFMLQIFSHKPPILQKNTELIKISTENLS